MHRQLIARSIGSIATLFIASCTSNPVTPTDASGDLGVTRNDGSIVVGDTGVLPATVDVPLSTDVPMGADVPTGITADVAAPVDGSDGVDCTPTHVACNGLPPLCGPLQVASVNGACWGPCVPIDRCVCGSPMDCPDPNMFTCNRLRGRCTPFL